jgi:hypothetical protein
MALWTLLVRTVWLAVRLANTNIATIRSSKTLPLMTIQRLFLRIQLRFILPVKPGSVSSGIEPRVETLVISENLGFLIAKHS